MTKLFPAILCGGSGTRLWPLSRAARPKQFHALTGDKSLLADTILRALTLPGVGAEDILLISGERLAGPVREEMQATMAQAARLIVEPIAKNTAPAAALAAFAALDAAPDSLVLLLPSDHHVGDESAFRATIAQGAELAARGFIVTFGIKPDKPHVGYGYIQRGAAEAPGFRVAKFHEKPKLADAERMLHLGGHDWNSGIYLFRPDIYLEELGKYAPAVRDAAERAWRAASAADGAIRPEPQAWGESPSISIDHAVAERTDRAATVPADMAWSDVGGWQALWDITPKAEGGNVLSGDVISIDAQNCYVRAGDRLVALIGVSDLVVIETADAVCIAPRERAEEVKKVVEALSGAGRKDML
ncbi:MAG: mannose-1-phosphate guanylyltransferase/mannose-6-phosphate isomerase [Hyphomonadaceae bacterium]